MEIDSSLISPLHLEKGIDSAVSPLLWHTHIILLLRPSYSPFRLGTQRATPSPEHWHFAWLLGREGDRKLGHRRMRTGNPSHLFKSWKETLQEQINGFCSLTNARPSSAVCLGNWKKMNLVVEDRAFLFCCLSGEGGTLQHYPSWLSICVKDVR